MQSPVIGVTSTRQTSEHGYPILTITEAYIQSLVQAGACPVIIPLGLSKLELNSLLDRLDGLLFSGGGDVHPAHYGNQFHPLVDDVILDRDEMELYLIPEAIHRRLPFLGICRGLQVINVALGGTLYEDVLEQHPGAQRHRYFPDMPRSFLAHNVDIVSGSRLENILGKKTAQVNSLHHQGIRQLAGGLQPTAYAPDGLIEAFELPTLPFGIAVQWHPEWLPEQASMHTLFFEFIQSARG
jgi:putative glutamine amidotransferase